MAQLNKGLASRNIVLLRKLSNALGVTIPDHVLKELGWKHNEILLLSIDDKKLIVRRCKLEVVP